MIGAARVVLVVSGLLLVMLGLVVVAEGGQGSLASALFLFVPGIVCLIAPWFERLRYRSNDRDRENLAAGPGGGEPSGPPEPRFQRTDEVFVDPTSGLRMRVFLDPRSGDRRYVAEG
jgi:hypothetical protein